MATNSYKQLQQYAKLLNTTLLLSASEIKHKINKDITLKWATHRDDIAVLENGDILTADPTSSNLFECKSYMQSHNIAIGKVYITTLAIIQLLRDEYNEISSQLQENKTTGEKQLMDLITLAVNHNASDIHMLIDKNTCTIQFRIDGLLVPITEWPASHGIRVHNVAYNFVASDKSDNFNRTKPQDISFTLHLNGDGDVRIRSSNIPTNNGGCNIVYRILSIGQKNVTKIEDLGYTEAQEKLLHLVKYLSSGLILICGETGSGKTTTLASILAEIDPRRKVYSIEDPVEKLVKNVTQIPVDPRDSSKDFAYYLRALLRQDPDVIMVGEIRDADTAKVAIQSALTGHLLLSTLHTKHAVDTILRLNELGLSPKIMATPNLLKLIVAQELHPLLCHKCRRLLTTNEKNQLANLYTKDELNSLYTTSNHKDQNKQCPQCEGKGITGRKVYAEMIRIDKKCYDFIAELNVKDWHKYLITQGFKTISERVRNAIKAGEIDALGVTRNPLEPECYNYE